MRANKIILRPWNIGDKASLAKYGNNPKVAQNMTDKFPSPYTLEMAAAFIENAHTDGQKVKKSKKSTIFELEQNKEKNARFTLR